MRRYLSILASLLQHQTLVFGSPPSENVCFLDRDGVDLVDRIILHRYKYIIFDTRYGKSNPGGILYLSLSIFKFMVFFMRKGWVPVHTNGRRKLFYAYSYAVLKLINPSVVLTIKGQYGPLMGTLANNLVGIRFMALPWTDMREFYLDQMIPAPIEHFVFGEREIEAFQQYGHDISLIEARGSLIGGYFINSMIARDQLIEHDVCIISQVPDILFEREMNDRQRSLIDSQILLAEHLNRYLDDTDLRVALAQRPQEKTPRKYEAELFLSRIATPIQLYPSIPEEFSTYQAMFKSEVIISAAYSTAAIDALGWGKKVLFCDFSSRRGWPEEMWWVVKSDQYEDFKISMDYLLRVDMDEYLSIIDSYRRSLNHINVHKPLHEFLGEELDLAVPGSIIDNK